jgi:hypothetical protein
MARIISLISSHPIELLAGRDVNQMQATRSYASGNALYLRLLYPHKRSMLAAIGSSELCQEPTLPRLLRSAAARPCCRRSGRPRKKGDRAPFGN